MSATQSQPDSSVSTNNYQSKPKKIDKNTNSYNMDFKIVPQHKNR